MEVIFLLGIAQALFLAILVFNKNEKSHEDYTLVVRDGKIVEMGPASFMELPGNVKVVDASGKFLIPALSDMHVHLEGDAWNIMYPPGEGYSPEELNFEDILFPYIANGITTVQVMSAFPEHIVLREKIQNHDIRGPRLVLSRMIDGAGKAWPPPISTWVNDPVEAGNAVREAHEQGYDRIKAYSFLDLASYDTLMKTAASLNIPVDGHIPLSTSLDHAISSGQKMIAHSEELPRFAEDFSAENIQDLSTRIAEADIWNYIYANLYKPIPESHRAHIKEAYDSFQLPFVNAFHASGGKLLSGSDVLIPANLPGFTLHGELETSGTIEPGKNANLVLLNANPLEDISNTRTIEGVIFKGRWISKQEIDSRLEQIAESYSELALSKNQ